MTKIEAVAEELTVEVNEQETIELALSDLDMVGGGVGISILA